MDKTPVQDVEKRLYEAKSRISQIWLAVDFKSTFTLFEYPFLGCANLARTYSDSEGAQPPQHAKKSITIEIIGKITP